MRTIRFAALLLAGLSIIVPVGTVLAVRGVHDPELWTILATTLLLGLPGVAAGLLLALSQARWARWSALLLSLLFLAVARGTAALLAGYLYFPAALGLVALSIIALWRDGQQTTAAGHW